MVRNSVRFYRRGREPGMLSEHNLVIDIFSEGGAGGAGPLVGNCSSRVISTWTVQNQWEMDS